MAHHAHITHEDEHHAAAEHIVPISVYVNVLIALMALLVVTVVAAFLDFDKLFHFGYFSMGIALFIAITKALLIIFFFMHIKYSPKLTWVFAGSAFFWLGIMIVLMFSDYSSRNFLSPEVPKTTVEMEGRTRAAPRHDSPSGSLTPHRNPALTRARLGVEERPAV
jgi:cytochrome c oxidase subunit 4